MENPALKTLIDDLGTVVDRLRDDVEAKEWQQALIRAKVMLGLASRTYGRLSGISDALGELEL
jgi:hypothetical protein